MKRIALLVFGCLLFGNISSRASDKLKPLDLSDVRLGGEMERRIQVTITNNLLKINLERDFLAPFRKHNQREGYIGLGKLIDATVKLAAYTHNTNLIDFKRQLVEQTIQLQEADGYIGIITATNRMWGMWDIHEMGYVIYGLLNDFRYFKSERSLDAAKKLADFIVKRWDSKPADWDSKTTIATHVSVTGIERTMLALYDVTKDKRYLDFVVKQRQLPDWNLGIVIGRRTGIEGHCYAYLCRSLALLELYRIMPQRSLLRIPQQAMDFIAGDGMAISGGTGQWEIWTDDQDVRGELGETCATAYQIRVYDSFLRLGGDAFYGDLIERTIWNTLFAAQSPEGRKLRYFSPLEGKRVYHDGDTYCCPCNYRRIIAELPGLAYYRASDGLAVNLYTPSEAEFNLSESVQVTLRQKTDYPNSGQIQLGVETSKPANFSLRLRIPLWCNNASIKVNDKVLKISAKPGSFAVIKRFWQNGDQVQLDLPMEWRLVAGRQRQAGRAAVMRGPLVFTLNPNLNKNILAMDAADLNRMVIDPSTFSAPVTNNAVRPGGIGCPVKLSKSSFGMGKGDIPVILTEFPDPDGQCSYFRLADPSFAVPDELHRQ